MSGQTCELHSQREGRFVEKCGDAASHRVRVDHGTRKGTPFVVCSSCLKRLGSVAMVERMEPTP